MADNAVTKAYDKAIDRAAMVRLHERRVNGKVGQVLAEHEDRLDKVIREGASRKAIQKELDDTFDEIHRTSSRSLIELMADQIGFQFQSLDAAIGKIWRTNRPDKAVPAEFVLKQPLVENDTLRQAWSKVSRAERQRIEAEIRKGVAEKRTVEEIAVAVRRGNVHKMSRQQSEALTITAITSVTAQADHAVYEANEKALQGWQYVAVLDSRTTEVCAHRDGKVYKVSQRDMLPPAHYRCRSTTIPVFKSWSQMAELEGVAEVRRQNLRRLTKKQQAYYDGQTPLRETYDDWIKRQPEEVQYKHLGDYKKVRLLNEGKLTLDSFTNDKGNSIGLTELKRLTYDTPVGDSRRFAIAKSTLDAMQLGATNADQLPDYFDTLRDYYLLQSKDLDGNLSLTNYRGALLHTKKATKTRVINSLPTEDQMRFNPLTGRYEDTRLYQPNQAVYDNALRLVRESDKIKQSDKDFILKMMDALELKMSMNERAVIADNLRIVIGRQRADGQPWGSLKGAIQAQLKFDIMNISDSLETQLRADSNPFKKLLQEAYIDPVLGPVQLQDLHDKFLDNIVARNRWEDKVAPKIASELRPIFSRDIPLKIKTRLSDRDLQQFYLRFAHRLAFAELPDRDTLAVTLGRDLYNLANLNGSRNEWYNLGMRLLENKRARKFYEIETYGVQKRRMRSRLSGNYFGPYYDTQAYNIRVTDPRIQEYSRLQRSVDLGLRVSVTSDKNRLVIRPGYKTYFIDRGVLGYEDTRIPVTSTSSYSDFPVDFIDKEFADTLNWASNTRYRIDADFYDFIDRLVYFEDDRGNAKKYNELNEYRKYLQSRADTYERFKTMAWLRKGDKAFSNHPFIDHRARVYDRGLISPQSGETFRPFLNTEAAKPLGVDGFRNLQDQIGAFLGGLDEVLEGNFNSLTITGRQKIAQRWRQDLVEIGQAMQRRRPADIRFVLEHPMVARIDGEEQGKFFRLALEQAKIDRYLREKAGVVFEEDGDGWIESVSEPGKKVYINDLFALAHGRPVKTVKLSEIEFFSDLKTAKLSREDKRRVDAADLNAPLIVEQNPGHDYNGHDYVWMDGWHRAVKAARMGRETIDVQVVRSSEVSKIAVDKATQRRPVRLRDRDPYSPDNLLSLNRYMTDFAIEQDASSSGAQIIALTTKNKQLAELSNVVPTKQKRRLYDEIAARTYSDPRFKALNEKLGLKEKDLRKAAKA